MAIGGPDKPPFSYNIKKLQRHLKPSKKKKPGTTQEDRSLCGLLDKLESLQQEFEEHLKEEADLSKIEYFTQNLQESLMESDEVKKLTEEQIWPETKTDETDERGKELRREYKKTVEQIIFMKFSKITRKLLRTPPAGNEWTWSDLISNTGRLRFRLVDPLISNPHHIDDDLSECIKKRMCTAAKVYTKSPKLQDPRDFLRFWSLSNEKTSEIFIQALVEPIVECLLTSEVFIKVQEDLPRYSQTWLPEKSKADFVVYDSNNRPLGAIEAKSVVKLCATSVIQNMLQVRALRAQEESRLLRESRGDRKPCEKPGVLFGIVTDAIHYFWFLLEEDGTFEFHKKKPSVTCYEHKGNDQQTCFLDEIRTGDAVRRIAGTVLSLFTLRKRSVLYVFIGKLQWPPA